MAFGPESTNPRERRAYADAKLAQAKASGTTEDFRAAREAVRGAGTSRKSRDADFKHRLETLAMRDPDTHAIFEKAVETLDPASPWRHFVRSFRTPNGNGIRHIENIVRESEPENGETVAIQTQHLIDSRTKEIRQAMPLLVQRYWMRSTDNMPPPDAIPTTDGFQINIVDVRALPDEKRQRMASLVRKIK